MLLVKLSFDSEPRTIDAPYAGHRLADIVPGAGKYCGGFRTSGNSLDVKFPLDGYRAPAPSPTVRRKSNQFA